ncbi:MAG TPA: CpsD/CapB family tyrosine-protein kinase [Mycobacteriales bacterium]|nr:CpsD/CapB family tyrosine-protein kinase [Mycobacteriales bacterium]
MAQGGSGLPNILDALRRRWPLALLVAVPMIAGVTYYAESLPASYGASAVISFAPRPNVDNGSEAMRYVVPKYVVYATARATVLKVAPTIDERPEDLFHAVDANLASETSNLTISVQLPTSERAARAVNALAAETVAFSGQDRLLEGQLVAPGQITRTPAGPPRRLYELAGIVLAVLAAASAAMLAERGRPRVRVPRDVVEATGLAVLGRVPPARALRGRPAEALADPAVGATIRSLRTYLEQESRQRPLHVLAVTSSQPGEGKSTIASAYAAAVARLETDVLLIDADLRRPGIHRYLGLGASPGLAEVLRGKSTLRTAVRPGPVARMSVLTTTVDPDAGDLLARRCAEVLAEARALYGVVIVDCPPLLAGDDARTLATQADGVLLVAATGVLVQSVAEASLILEALDARVLGVVLNRFRERHRPYGSYGAT